MSILKENSENGKQPTRSKHTLVVARYNEDISWIRNVPQQFRVVVYNKGNQIDFSGSNNIAINQVTNTGREAETYLRYLLESSFGDMDGHTVFSQGDPFEHSPDFLDLLRNVSQWQPVQPLSYRWKEQPSIPPEDILKNEVDDYVVGLRVRLETFSLYSMAPVYFYDWGAYNISNIYRSEYELCEGTNISQHFLETCGLSELANTANSHHLGQFSYGAIFAVTNTILAGLPSDAVSCMYQQSTSQAINAYMFERLWLHIFGLPFQ